LIWIDLIVKLWFIARYLLRDFGPIAFAKVETLNLVGWLLVGSCSMGRQMHRQCSIACHNVTISSLFQRIKRAVNTMWTTDNEIQLHPPSWESALYFLDRFTDMDAEFGIIDLVATEMFDLSHPATAEELDLKKALRAIRHKSSIAKSIIKWMAENEDPLNADSESLVAARLGDEVA
jgi:hypothetical protein